MGAINNRKYFFNPFPVEILQRVIARIMDSYYKNPREMFLFFYYPSDDYISCPMCQEQFLFVAYLNFHNVTYVAG